MSGKHDNNNAFGKELKRLRNEGKIKYSQAELAELADVAPGYISHLESGIRKPSAKLVRELSRHLGVEANHLFAKLGRVEMDFVSTLTNNREKVKDQMPSLSAEELDEIADYLTYLKFKSTILR